MYNEERSLAAMLSSLLDQSIPEGVLVTVVVVTNGCTDRSVGVALEVAQAALGVPPREDQWAGGLSWRFDATPLACAVLDTAVAGKVKALNTVHAFEEADVVLFFDSDIVLRPGAVSTMVAAFESKPSLVVAPSVEGIIEPRDHQAKRWHEVCRIAISRAVNEFDLCTPRLDGRVYGYRTDVVEEHPPVVAVDMWLEGHAWRSGAGVAYLEVPLIWYRLPASLEELVAQYTRYGVTLRDLEQHEPGILSSIGAGRKLAAPRRPPRRRWRVVGWLFLRYIARRSSSERYEEGEPWRVARSTKR